jgi:hypothetical protein
MRIVGSAKSTLSLVGATRSDCVNHSCSRLAKAIITCTSRQSMSPGVLRPGVRVWQPPYAVEPIKVPGKKQRAEYYRWLLRLESDER